MSQKVAFVVVFKNDLVNILQLYFKNNLQMSILFFFKTLNACSLCSESLPVILCFLYKCHQNVCILL